MRIQKLVVLSILLTLLSNLSHGQRINSHIYEFKNVIYDLKLKKEESKFLTHDYIQALLVLNPSCLTELRDSIPEILKKTYIDESKLYQFNIQDFTFKYNVNIVDIRKFFENQILFNDINDTIGYNIHTDLGFDSQISIIILGDNRAYYTIYSEGSTTFLAVLSDFELKIELIEMILE